MCIKSRNSLRGITVTVPTINRIRREWLSSAQNDWLTISVGIHNSDVTSLRIYKKKNKKNNADRISIYGVPDNGLLLCSIRHWKIILSRIYIYIYISITDVGGAGTFYFNMPRNSWRTATTRYTSTLNHC